MKHELLTLWFLRLNGYFCVPNFIIHPDAPGPQRTDADVLALRFPHCLEVAGAPIPQDDTFIIGDRIDFLVAEVKAGECRLNGPWAAPGPRNIQYVLRWMGFLERNNELEDVAAALYDDKKWDENHRRICVRIACFGRRPSAAHGMRDVLQRTHLDSVRFIVDRFRRFQTEKADQRQWDGFIRQVFGMAWKGATPEQIMEWVDD